MESKGWRERLRTAWKSSGRSMRDVSLSAGFGRNYLNAILTEGKEPGLESFVKICAELGADPLFVIFNIGQDDADQVTRELFRSFSAMTPEQRANFLALAKSIAKPSI